jgi:hypothetical protein
VIEIFFVPDQTLKSCKQHYNGLKQPLTISSKFLGALAGHLLQKNPSTERDTSRSSEPQSGVG